MFIQMLSQITGLRDGVPWPPPGHVADVPDSEAALLIQNHMAVPAVDPDTGVELAVRDPLPVERRTRRTAHA